MSGCLEIVLSDKMQETLGTKKIDKAQKHSMLYTRLCYLLLFLLIVSQRKQNEKQHKAGFKMQFLRNVLFSPNSFLICTSVRVVSVGDLSPRLQLWGSATFWGKSAPSATFLSLKSCLLGQHRDTLKISAPRAQLAFLRKGLENDASNTPE